MFTGASHAREITPAEVQRLWEDNAPAAYVDVREPWEWDEGHLPGALLMPLGALAARCETELDRSAQIICICAHGIRSAHAAEYLVSRGYANVATMVDGMSGYAGPVETSGVR